MRQVFLSGILQFYSYRIMPLLSSMEHRFISCIETVTDEDENGSTSENPQDVLQSAFTVSAE